MDYRQRIAIEQANKRKWLAVNKWVTEESGIYILTRTDEQGIRYAYIGQAVHLLTRLAQHLSGYQHIDLSLKKHGLYDKINNPHGWDVSIIKVSEENLDEYEKKNVKLYADLGYQLRNKTAGGQGEGKVQIDEYKPSKGYYDGKKQGRNDLLKELQTPLKYVVITPKDEGKLSKRMYDKLCDLLGGKENG